MLRIEHPQLVELDINYGDFEFVELKCPSKLRHMAYVHWECHGDPLSFGDVPLLSSLSLTNTSAGWQKNLRLSQLLSTVTSISDLLLNFESEKVLASCLLFRSFLCLCFVSYSLRILMYNDVDFLINI